MLAARDPKPLTCLWVAQGVLVVESCCYISTRHSKRLRSVAAVKTRCAVPEGFRFVPSDGKGDISGSPFDMLKLVTI